MKISRFLSAISVSLILLGCNGAHTNDKSGEFNEAWADSVPYLLERARQLDPKAFGALGDCYRYGRGGLEKSVFNAYMYYNESDLDMGALIEQAAAADSTDELARVAFVMNGLHDDSMTDSALVCYLASIPEPRPAWAGFMGEVLSQPAEERQNFILSAFESPRTADEYFIGSEYLAMSTELSYFHRLAYSSPDSLDKAREVCAKLPPFYDMIGGALYRRWHADPVADAACLNPALEFMHGAYRHGVLSKSGMAAVLIYCRDNNKTEVAGFTPDDLALFSELCPPEYIEAVETPAAVDEEVPAE